MAASALGCEPHVEPASLPRVEATLLGYRAISGDPPVWWFDDARRPYLRVESPQGTGWELVLERAGRADVLPLGGEPRTGGVILRVGSWPPQPLGRMRIVLRRADAASVAVAEWPARWVRPPEDDPRVRSVSSIEDPEARRTALRQVVRRGGDAALWCSLELSRLAARLEPHRAASVASWAGDLASSLGVWTEARRRYGAASYYADSMGDFTRGGRHLERASQLANDVEGAIFQAEAEATHSFRMGRFADAEARWSRARADAHAHALDDLVCGIDQNLALLLSAYGRHDAAMAAIHRALECRRDQLTLVNAGWIALQRATAEGRPAAADEGLRFLRLALEAPATPEAPAAPYTAYLNGAIAHVSRRDVPSAKAWIDDARTSPAPVREHAGYLEWLEGRVALLEGQPRRALSDFEEARARLEEVFGAQPTELSWRIGLAQGEALVALGDVRGAIPRLEAALDALERVGRETALRPGRASFFADKRAVDRALLAAYLRVGRLEDAFALVDRGRARLLRSAWFRARLDRLEGAERARWAELAGALERAAQARAGLEEAVVPASEAARHGEAIAAARRREAEAYDEAFAFLESVGPGLEGRSAAEVQAGLAEDEALVVYADAAEEAPLAFVATRRRLRLVPDLATLPRALEGAAHVYVVPAGLAHPAAPIAADGSPWARASISYLPFAGFLAAPPPASPGQPRPLVVADPGRDLPHARAEADQLARGWPGAVVLEGDAATAERVRAELARVSAVHFAGHGVLTAEDPWDAHLALADGGRLTVAELLLLRVQAGLVVLNGCETGRETELFREDVLTLPEAFLAAGAQTVVATTRAVGDEEARRFLARFYAAGGAERPAEAFRAAMLAAQAEGDPAQEAFLLVGRRRPFAEAAVRRAAPPKDAGEWTSTLRGAVSSRRPRPLGP